MTFWIFFARMGGMKIYEISQNINSCYDTYDSAIVCAESEEEARTIHPDGDHVDFDENGWFTTSDTGIRWDRDSDTWVDPKDINKIKVEFLGVAKEEIKKGVMLASFNAG